MKTETLKVIWYILQFETNRENRLTIVFSLVVRITSLTAEQRLSPNLRNARVKDVRASCGKALRRNVG